MHLMPMKYYKEAFNELISMKRALNEQILFEEDERNQICQILKRFKPKLIRKLEIAVLLKRPEVT